MKRNVVKLVFLFQIAITLNIQSQDALFSQYHTVKALLNPSLSAIQNGPLAFQLNFREQAASVSSGTPIRTYYALANFQFNAAKEDKFNFGIDVMSDKGGAGHIGKTMSHLNFSYLKKLSSNYSNTGEHFLSLGTQLGAGQHSTRWGDFWFGNQFDIEGGFVDESIDSGESEIENSAVGSSNLFTDINFGLSWYANLSEKFSAYAGASMYHMNRPNISLFAGEVTRLSSRINFHGGMNIGVGEIVNVNPQAIYITQGKSNQFILGSEIGIDNKDDFEIAMKLGVFARFVSNYNNFGPDAMVVSATFDYNKLRFALAYDLTISALSKYNNARGAWEFSFGYLLSDDKLSGYRKPRSKFRL